MLALCKLQATLRGKNCEMVGGGMVHICATPVTVLIQLSAGKFFLLLSYYLYLQQINIYLFLKIYINNK